MKIALTRNMKMGLFIFCLLISSVLFAQTDNAVSGATNCYWIEPDASYIHPNPAQWPGSPGNSTDNYSDPINLGWDFNYFGQPFNQVVLTTKGTIVLGSSGYIDFTPSAFPTPEATESTPQHDHICGFWTDSDFGSTGDIYYKLTSEALYVNYIDVGFWPNNSSLTNSFQMIICMDGSNVIGNNNNVQFCYRDMNYANSQMSGAQNGFSANNNLAIVGCDRVSGDQHHAFGRFNLNNSNYNGPYGIAPNEQDGVKWLNGKVIEFSTSVDATENVPPGIMHNVCNPVTLCQGESTAFEVYFTSASTTQNVSVALDGLFDGFAYTITIMNNAVQLSGTIVSNTNNVGTHTLTFTGMDDGTPSASSTISFDFIINSSAPPVATIDGELAMCAGGSTVLTATTGMDSYAWSNGSDQQQTTVTDAGYTSVIVGQNGCYDTLEVFVNEELFEGFLCSYDPIEICEGDTATLCALDNYNAYEWSVYPGYSGQFVDGVPLDQPTVQIIGTGNDAYQVHVVDAMGCEGIAIVAVNALHFVIDPVNEQNSGAYCNGLEPVEFTGGYFPTGLHPLIIYGLSTTINGWQNAHIDVTIIHPDGSAETGSFTANSSLFVYDDLQMGQGDSIVVEYVITGNQTGNSIWIFNCDGTSPDIIPLPTTSGIVWSGLSSCVDETLSGSWSVSGPEGWNMTDMNNYNGIFTPSQYGQYELCFQVEGCASEHCYDVEYNVHPQIDLLSIGGPLLCGDELLSLTLSLNPPLSSMINNNTYIVWDGIQIAPAPDGLSAVAGPFDGFIGGVISVEVSNVCGIDSAARGYNHVDLIPDLSYPDQYLCGQPIVIDPLPDELDNDAYTYTWSSPLPNVSSHLENLPGTYWFMISNDCGTSPVISFEVIQTDPLQGSCVASGPTAVCNASASPNYTTTDLNGALYYNWFLFPSDAGTIVYNGVNAEVDFSDSFVGTAELVVVGINECSHSEPVALSIDVQACNSIVQTTAESFSVYPNPAMDRLTIACDEKILRTIWIDELGRTTESGTTKTIDISNMPSGHYFLKVITDSHSYFQRVVVVR